MELKEHRIRSLENECLLRFPSHMWGVYHNQPRTLFPSSYLFPVKVWPPKIPTKFTVVVVVAVTGSLQAKNEGYSEHEKNKKEQSMVTTEKRRRHLNTNSQFFQGSRCFGRLKTQRHQTLRRNQWKVYPALWGPGKERNYKMDSRFQISGNSFNSTKQKLPWKMVTFRFFVLKQVEWTS